jgi:hypothetical protein
MVILPRLRGVVRKRYRNGGNCKKAQYLRYLKLLLLRNKYEL